MMLKKRVLDFYFLNQIKKQGVQATELEVTQFFEETGWRMYELDSMIKKFVVWRNLKQKMEVGVE